MKKGPRKLTKYTYIDIDGHKDSTGVINTKYVYHPFQYKKEKKRKKEKKNKTTTKNKAKNKP